MSPEKILRKFETVATVWLDALPGYSEDELRRAPSGGWSIGQVYSHVIDAVTSMALPQFEKCLSPGRERTTQGKNRLGHVFLFLGSFPPIRVKFRASDYVPAQPSSKAELERDFRAMIEGVRVASRGVRESDARKRAKHPVLGFLNAKEWLQIMEMHTRHHLRQKRRLDLFLRSDPQGD